MVTIAIKFVIKVFPTAELLRMLVEVEFMQAEVDYLSCLCILRV